MWTLIGITGLGLSLAAISVWSWQGRLPGSRWWDGLYLGRETALAIIPALSILIIACTAITAAETYAPAIHSIVFAVAALPLLAGGTLMVAGMFACLPRWWAPSWWDPHTPTTAGPF